MYRGQITALLGHNGAGKTTTISMLTGLFAPSSGTAIINGYDMLTDIDGVHSSLGICPQHDILFDDLTVEEHLYFFTKLKGYTNQLTAIEINRMIEALGLEDKRTALSKTLSGGMKRKLSVGIALVGGSKVVMLDEPTSGMDPAARRFTWDLLNAEKENRTILLTTHFMEEADILGDRIAIMSDGEIQCCGSPLFLKKKYGAGYHMVIVKQPNCDPNDITSLIYSYIPLAELESNIGAELSFCLPHNSSSQFEGLFTHLEVNKDSLGISSYGASITTMEEVFLRVGEYSHSGMQSLLAQDHSEQQNQTHFESRFLASRSHDASPRLPGSKEFFTGSSHSELHDLSSSEVQKLNHGKALFMQQLHALLTKRMLYTMRNWMLTCSQMILPVFFITLTLIMLKTLPKPGDSPPLQLDLHPFGGTKVPVAYSGTTEVENRLANLYISHVNNSVDTPSIVNTTHQDLINYLLSEGRKDIGSFNLRNIVGASFARNRQSHDSMLVALFNNQAYHSPGISLALLDGILLNFVTNRTWQFSVTNHPLPRTVVERASQQQAQGTEAYQIAQDIMFGMSFLAASFAIFLVKERSSKAKHLQRVSGVNLLGFWATTFAWDFLNYFIPCVFVMMAFVFFETEGLSSGEEQGRLLLLFFVHGWAVLPFTYVLSFMFDLPSTAYVRISLFNIVSGIAGLVAVTVMELPQLSLQDASKIVDWTLSTVLPNYCLGRSVSNLYQNHQFLEICNQAMVQAACNQSTYDFVVSCCKGKCEDKCVPWDTNYLSWNAPGIGRLLCFLVVQSFLFWSLLVACELNAFRTASYWLCKSSKRTPVVSVAATGDEEEIGLDDDVLAERNRILTTPLMQLFHTDTLILQELAKVYDTVTVVDSLSFGVKRGECFGLLGINGAGKTTTFKMLTGDESVSSGNAYLYGYSIKGDIRQVQQQLGYCPQFDATIDQLTGRETLCLFARLRGVPEDVIPGQVERLSKMLYFDIHIDKLVKDYSGGNKRKLSTAVALVGDPPVIFLDEPTTGMDPVARRCLWDALIKVLASGRSIILTSHSMEECEALCNRLVIMVNGRLCCLGSPQHLKNKFGQGYTLLAKVGRQTRRPSSSAADAAAPKTDSIPVVRQTSAQWQASVTEELHRNVVKLKQFIESTFRGSVLKGTHQGLVHYHIPNTNLTWAEIFGTMERSKEQFGIEDYSVGQTTLEQVFLNFARLQRHVDG